MKNVLCSFKAIYYSVPFIHGIILVRPMVHIIRREEGPMAEINITIDGMSCQHCVMESNVQLGRAVVKYDENKAKKEDIEARIENAGYKIAK